jgi:hypothetical protein
MLFYLSLTILVFVLGAQLWLRFFVNRRGLTQANTQINADIFKYIFLISLFLISGLLFYQSFKQYQLWSQNEISQYLLPPHRSINYFIFYVFRRIFVPYLISLTVAILFFFSAKFFNKKYEERFFYPEEYYLGALAMFLMSHPGWLFYLIFLISAYLLIHICSSFIVHSSSFRISLYYLWIPTTIFVILISRWFEHLSLWSLLKI